MFGEVFYSLMWHTPPETAIVMTFSQGACRDGLEFWTRRGESPTRVLLVSPAWFRLYRPRLGLAADLGALADEPDTMVAIYAPPRMIAAAVWKDTHLDVAATVRRWLGDDGKLLTFATYVAELEVDMLAA